MSGRSGDDAGAAKLSFIDHRAIEWPRVRRTQLLVQQQFQYTYAGPVREVRQRLLVVPADRHGHQQLGDYRLDVSAPPSEQHAERDGFGNRVFRFQIAEVDSRLVFESRYRVTHHVAAPQRPPLPAAYAAGFLAPTPLTTADAPLSEAARELRERYGDPRELAEAINSWVFAAMSYAHGVTTTHTTAAEARTLGRGLCQDYAHIMLAVCRAAGLPARYVSGHLLGEGGSHAWVEALLPGSRAGTLEAWALDPTNHRHAGYHYITVAVGRDYRDVAPTSGSFVAPYGGSLQASKQAGIVAVEYLDGDVVRSDGA